MSSAADCEFPGSLVVGGSLEVGSVEVDGAGSGGVVDEVGSEDELGVDAGGGGVLGGVAGGIAAVGVTGGTTGTGVTGVVGLGVAVDGAGGMADGAVGAVWIGAVTLGETSRPSSAAPQPRTNQAPTPLSRCRHARLPARLWEGAGRSNVGTVMCALCGVRRHRSPNCARLHLVSRRRPIRITALPYACDSTARTQECGSGPSSRGRRCPGRGLVAPARLWPCGRRSGWRFAIGP